MVKLNKKSMEMLKNNEGCVLTAYYDTVGVITIGYGSARTFRGRPIYEGMTITQEEAELALEEDIPNYQQFLGYFKKDFNANQIGALTSFEYNVGQVWYLPKDGWSPDYDDATIVESLGNYLKPPEITSRRMREIALYNDPDVEGDGSDYGGEIPNPSPTPEDPQENPSNSPSEIDEKMKKLLDSFINFLEEKMTKNIYTYSKDYSCNNYIKVIKTFDNTYKVKLLPKLYEGIMDLLTIDNTGQADKPVEPTNPDTPASPPSGNMSDLWQWCEDRQGQSFDFDGAYGAQCVDLITWINSEFQLGLNLANNPNYGSPETMYAKRIYENPLPNNWHKVEGNPNDDVEAEKIWNSLPLGAIVWFTNSVAGHVGLKAGDWVLTFNQNVDNLEGTGGPLRKTQLLSFIQGGSGFLGAWVLNE